MDKSTKPIQRKMKKKSWIAYCIPFLGLILTLICSYYTKKTIENQSEETFHLLCNEIKSKINLRLQVQALVLRSATSLFSVTDSVTKEDWTFFYNKAKIKKNLPGINELGYAIMIPKKDLQRHILQIKKAGIPQYTIYPLGERDFYSSILYVLPQSAYNETSIGYDMLTDSIKRKALFYARDNDISTITQKITFTNYSTNKTEAGVMMVTPVYKNGMPILTKEQRSLALKGWVYNDYCMGNLFEGIVGLIDKFQGEGIHIKIFDSENYSINTLLYESQNNTSYEKANSVKKSINTFIDFNGKKWYLQFSKNHERLWTEYKIAFIVLIVGFVLNFLVYYVVLLLVTITYRANLIAENLSADLLKSNEELEKRVQERTYALEKLTQKLQENELQLRTLLNTIPEYVWFKNIKGEYVFCNSMFEKRFNVNAEVV